MTKRKFKKRRPYEKIENPRTVFRKMTRDHVDVLENIEFALVSAWRKDASIDDRAVALALKAAIVQSPPADALAARLYGELAAVRSFREDVADDIWKAGLKVVLESVHTHSDAAPGDYEYLSFAGAFLP